MSKIYSPLATILGAGKSHIRCVIDGKTAHFVHLKPTGHFSGYNYSEIIWFYKLS